MSESNGDPVERDERSGVKQKPDPTPFLPQPVLMVFVRSDGLLDWRSSLSADQVVSLCERLKFSVLAGLTVNQGIPPGPVEVKDAPSA